MKKHWIAVWGVLVWCLAGGPVGAQELNRPPEGFVALFNGRDLTNWQGLIDIKTRAALTPEQRRERQRAADEQMSAHWSVREGVLVYDGKGNSLQTARDYGNFELYVDWKIQKNGDSGLYLRGNPQVQIWDPADRPEGSGGLFNNKKNPSKPLAVADRPIGEWNTFWIRMVGDRVTIKLNGKLVVDDTPLENYWFPNEPLPMKGPIELQHHGNQLEFRNIFLKELPDSVAALPVTLELSNVSLTRVIQLLGASSGVEIIFRDPDGKLGRKELQYVRIVEKPVGKALEIVCRSAGLKLTQDDDGVYLISSP